MADLVASNYDLILVFPRFGISLGFGECSVAEVCRRYSVPLNLFLIVCNIYSFDGYFPDSDEVRALDFHSLVDYLKASHRYYLQERLPHMQRHLEHIVANAEPATATLLKKYFSDYQAEVASHFANEEHALFPLLSSLPKGQPLDRAITDKYVISHEIMKDKLADLTQIIYKYLPGNILTEELMELIFGILQLSKDFEKHALIEDRLLIANDDGLLSQRETQVLVLLAQGLSSKLIADKLNISVHTVSTHRRHIIQKTGIKSVAALALYAALHHLHP